MNEELRDTAYHEAGHAVMGHLAGCGFKSATIQPNEDRSLLGVVYHPGALARGHTPETLYDITGGTRAETELQIMLALSGGIAGKRATGTYDEEGCSSDNDRIADWAIRWSADPDTYIEQLCARTERLLDWAWPAVEALAALLLERTTLDGEEGARLIDATLPAERKGAAAWLESRLAGLEEELIDIRQDVRVLRSKVFGPPPIPPSEGAPH